MNPHSNINKYVRNCASIAALLEVSAYPKPGNIHRLNDFPSTCYEHFLAGGVALGTVMGEIAERSSLSNDWSDIRLGEGVKNAVGDMLSWQNGGNIHLGVILLFVPLSAGAGVTLSKVDFDCDLLREYTNKIISKADSKDSVNIYTAIDLAMSKDILGSVDKLDVKDKNSKKMITNENIIPLEIFKVCKDRDLICREWVTGFSVVFETGYPYLAKRIADGANINNATIDTFLKILAENPDSLITRKSGVKSAEYVSQKAQSILEIGGTSNEKGINMIWSFDKELRKEKGRLNPGTSADLTAASLYVLLLSGWRP